MSLRVSRGQFTPVLAQALVLENGSDAVIFVSCDVVSVNPDVVLKAQEILKKEIPGFPAEKLIVNATHTHPSHNYTVRTRCDTSSGSTLGILTSIFWSSLAPT